jgi:ParB family chromosome partitioning protein
MTDTLAMALNKLTPWKGNVRETGAKDGIEELAASIAAHGRSPSPEIGEGAACQFGIGRRLPCAA